MSDYYILDGKLVHWEHLVKVAGQLDSDFFNKDIQRTSEAANILREHGHSVGSGAA